VKNCIIGCNTWVFNFTLSAVALPDQSLNAKLISAQMTG